MDINQRSWREEFIKDYQGILLHNATIKQSIELMVEDADFMPYSWHQEVNKNYAEILDSIKDIIQKIRTIREEISGKRLY